MVISVKYFKKWKDKSTYEFILSTGPTSR